MRYRFPILLMIFLLLAPAAPAQEMPFADLRALAPAGTFLPPGEAPQMTDTTYRSQDIAVTITKHRYEDSDVYVADIYLASVSHLRRVFSHGRWNKNAQRAQVLAQDARAIVAITGDYSGLLSQGLVVGNGQVLRSTGNRVRDNCLIYPDGRMQTFARRELDVKAAVQSPIWQSFLFGPALLGPDGQAIDKFDSNIGVANPRSVIGYYAPGHYCFVLADGRQKGSRGLALVLLSRFMAELGCAAAYNLDGGQSALLWFGGQVVNNPYKGGRPLTDMVYIGE
ncbi:MAG: phosphodiester glycosidase family protein [Clostridiales bacterium]|nr:phosphodiester glycosidase family protein [Clostridiales bacterium]